MKPRLLLLCPLLAAASLAARAATPVIGAQLFQETNARIEELFHDRDNPPKPPGPLDNPFRLTDTGPSSATPPAGPKGATIAPDQDPTQAATPDEAMLRLACSDLTFGGLIEVGDRLMVVINKANCREGGLVTVRVQGASVYIRIVKLTRDQITFGLNEARLTLHF
ncbi:MAG: hypothetical protein JSR48_04185 [Verrucomicrobia bacterium]|nr:hypothetical protein [Verrucomicrobiota bacterium]